jgi:hypothetical protein
VLGVESLEFEIVRGISSVSSTYNAKEESLNSQPVLMRVCRDQIWPRFAHTHSVSPFDMFFRSFADEHNRRYPAPRQELF